jgi:hypothetical protein
MPRDITFQTREVIVLPGAVHAYKAEEWRDALVVVQEGTIELEMLHGSRRTFVRGDAMWFDGSRLRLLRNRGSLPALLLATSRRRAPFH